MAASSLHAWRVMKLPTFETKTPQPPKKTITMKVDEDVLAWFKSFGPGYQTRINASLRWFMERSKEEHGEEGESEESRQPTR